MAVFLTFEFQRYLISNNSVGSLQLISEAAAHAGVTQLRVCVYHGSYSECRAPTGEKRSLKYVKNTEPFVSAALTKQKSRDSQSR